MANSKTNHQIKTLLQSAFLTGMVFVLGCGTSSTSVNTSMENSQPNKTRPATSQSTRANRPEQEKQPAPNQKPNKKADDAKIVNDKLLGVEVVAGELLVTVFDQVKQADLEKALKSLPMKATVNKQIANSKTFKVSVPVKNTHEARIRLLNHPYVAACGLNTVRTLNRTYNDPVFKPESENDWNLKRINAPQAWDISTGGARIAIVDSGIKADHEEFENKLVGPYSVYTRSSNMQTGLVKENFGGRLHDNYITNHGTHVAGTAAGRADNSKGTSGVAPASPIMPIQVLTYNPNRQRIQATSDEPLLAGLHKAIDQGAKVINYSIGGPPQDSLLNPWLNAKNENEKAIAEANIMRNVQANLEQYKGLLDKAERQKVIFVKSAGNDDLPAKFDILSFSRRVISVAATNKQDGRAIFSKVQASNFGPYTTVSAPGQEIWNAVSNPSQPYAMMAGTSMAAPHVAGVVALMKTVDPDLTPNEAVDILVSTGRRLNTDKPIGPLVNAEAALKELKRRRQSNVRRPKQPTPLIPQPKVNPCLPRLPRNGVDICRGPRPWENVDVRRLIDLWLCIAVPVIQNLDPSEGPYICDRYGRTISVKVIFTIAPPRYAKTRYQWIWENGRTLRSSNHGTLFSFVIEMMKRGTFDPAPAPLGPAPKPANKNAKVIRTLEYHQLTNNPGAIFNHEGGRVGFDGKTIVYGFQPKKQREGEVWSLPFEGGKPTLLDRYAKDFKGPGWPVSKKVDMSLKAPHYVIHTNGAGYLKYIPMNAAGQKTGTPKEIFKATGRANIVNIRASHVPYILLSGNGERTDQGKKSPILAGVHSLSPNGTSTPVLTNKMVAGLVGCEPNEVSFSGGSRFHFDVSQNGNVVVTLHILPTHKKRAALFGSYLVGIKSGTNRPFIIKKKVGEGSRYTFPRISISPNGKKIAYCVARIYQTYVANFDGSNEKMLTDKTKMYGYQSGTAPFQLSTDGTYLLNGGNGVLMRTGSGEAIGLGNSPRTYDMMGWELPKSQMGLEPGKFIFHRGFKTGQQICSAELNASNSKHSAPKIKGYELEPEALPAYGSKQRTIARAEVSKKTGIKNVIASVSQNGLIDRKIYFAQMKDDGNKKLGDIANDNVYSDHRYAVPKDSTGVRNVRFDVESEDSDGKRHGHAIVIGPISISNFDDKSTSTN